ncbi:N-acetylmuramoyl-L-alanine amidase [Halopseudomonas pertucinogena]|uniref:N-acetylmuramoyl-L-alanine amidase n=1 Tax=Halopseudomonas pertucinogena TaxID=86175 RepID=A0ABQ2CT42_9GAMM|nr:N-acetylmuramoyl-L-alanine amidase [Halopseudomonas pertucinogena]GGJ06718.1 N-acetylmuramoyl-L-alanine amidase [Halopseudomonas pertucinogena]
MQTKSLFISAGHSASDPGAVGNGYTEAAIVLEFRDYLAEALRARGIEFSKDGGRGENLPLSRAWRMAADHDIAVEFHCNAFSRPSATGVETLSHPEHMELGRAICTAISDTLGIVNRGAKGEGSGQHSRLAFVSSGGGIIVELFFISNPDDVAKYQRWKLQLAEVLADLLAEEVRNA